jgi:sulfur carrier protein
MDLIINGDPVLIKTATTVGELLGELGYSDPFVAVAVNKTCVRRAEFGATQLCSGDEVEILAPMAGG